MKTPSCQPSPPTQISTNAKQPKTPHSELSQAAPQTQTSNIYTQKQKYSHSEPTSNSMHHNSDIKPSYLHILFVHLQSKPQVTDKWNKSPSKTLSSPQTSTATQPIQQRQ